MQKISSSILFFVIIFMVSFVLVDDVNGDAFVNIDSDQYILEINKNGEFDIAYRNMDYDEYDNMEMSIIYNAKLIDSSNENQYSNLVTPSSGDLDNGVSRSLIVTAPDSVGMYVLEVDFEMNGTYIDNNGEQHSMYDYLTKRYTFKAVIPIKLSVKLTNNSSVDLSGFGVYFYVNVDGNSQRLDDSYRTANIDRYGSTVISYDWITDVEKGAYKFYVLPTNTEDINHINGIGDEHAFYVGYNHYNICIIVIIIAVFLLTITYIFIYSKPVKNFGKPKSRSK